MNVETEHKYLVRKDLWYAIHKPEGTSILQGYIFSDSSRTVRVRIYGDKGFLTIKGPAVAASRDEYEYEIPLSDAHSLLKNFCGHIIDKIRYRLDYKGNTWEIDEFFGENEGLVLAEIELKSPDQQYETPPWVGEDVTGDIRYTNSYLAENPIS